MRIFRVFRALGLLAAGALLLFGGHARSLQAEGEGQAFASPEAAAQAVAAACEKNDLPALVAIFGKGSEDLLDTGSAEIDKASRLKVAAMIRQAVKVEPSADGSTTILVFGYTQWPFPVPLVKQGANFRFDTASARDEILARRIGENELSTLELLRFVVEAQAAYSAADRDGDGAREYAARIMSTEGKRDGLHWESAAGEEPSPLGPYVAKAGPAAEQHKPGEPWQGYLFRLITKQGPNAPGGEFNYMSPKGDMLGGWAMLAWPAEYRVSGVMTFLVNRDGRVMEKDLGEKTAEAAAAITSYDPDATWTLNLDDDEPEPAPAAQPGK